MARRRSDAGKSGSARFEQPVDRAEELHRGPGLVRAGRPLAHRLRRRDEQLGDARRRADWRARGFKACSTSSGTMHRARPVGNLVEMERKPARQQHDLDRHRRHAAPGNCAVEREQEAGEDIAPCRPAMGENRFARAAHVRRVGIVADHLEREIGLDAGADVERAGVNERPAAMVALDSPQIDGDQALELEIGLFAAKVPRAARIRPGMVASASSSKHQWPSSLLRGEQRLRGAGRCGVRGPPPTARLPRWIAGRCSCRSHSRRGVFGASRARFRR